MKYRKGFTLIESMIVIAIVAFVFISTITIKPIDQKAKIDTIEYKDTSYCKDSKKPRGIYNEF